MLRCERAFPIFHFHWKHIWPYPSRVQPETCRLGQLPSAYKSLNFWHFFKLRDIVLLPACVCERESERGVEGAVSAMRVFCLRGGHFPSVTTHIHTHTHACQAAAPCCHNYQHVIPTLCSICGSQIYREYPCPPTHFLLTAALRAGFSIVKTWLVAFWFYFISFFFHFFLRSPSILFFGFQFRPS